jgi:hypothetical protein
MFSELETPMAKEDDRIQWALLRRALRPEDKFILADTKDLLAHLPDEVCPINLAEAYPRIINEIRLRWADTEALMAYFTELTTDLRGDREGFPEPILKEILALKAHVDKRIDTSWDSRWAD